MQKIKRDDTVLILKGKDRGRTGSVRRVQPDRNRVVVSGVNIVKRHMRPRGPQQPGGIVEREAPMPWANVAVLCGSCEKPARVGVRVQADNVKVRFCKRCGEVLD